MNEVAMMLMAFGAMVLFIPQIADPYMTPRLLLVAIGAGIIMAKKNRGSSCMEKPALAFLAAAAVSWLYAQDASYALVGSYQFPMDSVIAFVCYACVLGASARSGLSVDEVARMIAGMSVPVSAYAIFQRFFHDPMLWGELHSGMRVSSSQGGPIFLAAVLAVAALCSLHLARKGERAAWVSLAAAVAALWFTQTRGGFLALAVGAAFVFRGSLLMLIPALVLMGRTLSKMSDLARIEVWKVGVKTFLEHPFVGYGPGNFYLAFRKNVGWDFVDIMGNATAVQSHAHNDILHVAATMGVLGLAAYLFVGYSALRVAMQHPERKLLLGVLAAYVAMGFFNPVTTSVFVLMAMIFGAASCSIKVGDEWQRRLVPAAACLAVFVVVGRMTLASHHIAKAVVHADDRYRSAVEFNRAAQLNPWEMMYTCRQVDSMMKLVPYAAPKERRNMAALGRDIAQVALKRHPMDSYAHELYGKQILIAQMAQFSDADPREAMYEFNKAQDLAPTFEILMWRRRATARGLGNADEVMLADQDIADLRAAVAPGRKG